jgi:DNA replication and repair protein RecF
MRVVSVTVRDFRGYSSATAPLGGCLTVVHGPNGAGKSNLLEAVYFGCTGRSCRTANDKELVRFGEQTTRVVVETEDQDGTHQLAVGLTPGEDKKMFVDGAPVPRLLDVDLRPLISVFLPERLELVKGVPALRRAHLDQLIAALWPARVAARRAYSQTLAQRNALLSRVRAGWAPSSTLEPWSEQLARQALVLMADRQEALDLLAPAFIGIASRLGLDGDPGVRYRPRSKASTAEQFVAELDARLETDLERGFTSHGPHRDELVFSRAGRELRTYGSQGQQRLAILSLLLAEREVLATRRNAAPLMLLDDVMSELDATRRSALVEQLTATDGQALITTTDADHVPAGDRSDTVLIAVEDGELTTSAGRELAMTGPAGDD